MIRILEEMRNEPASIQLKLSRNMLMNLLTEASGEREITYKKSGDDETSARKLTRARGYLLVK